jgi:hypothetical protein
LANSAKDNFFASIRDRIRFSTPRHRYLNRMWISKWSE